MSSEKIDELLLAEYQHAAESFLSNEELGDRRVNIFLVIALGALAVIGGFFAENAADAVENAPFAAVSAVLLLAVWWFGRHTLDKIVDRNVETDRLLWGLTRIRAHFASRDRELAALLVNNPSRYAGTYVPRSGRSWNAGLAQFTIVLNGLVATVLLLAGVHAVVLLRAGTDVCGPDVYGPAWITVPVTLLALSITLEWQWLRRAYRKNQKKVKAGLLEPLPGYRRGVGILLIDAEGMVLALERKDPKDPDKEAQSSARERNKPKRRERKQPWQMAQGGIEEGEDPEDALYRELEEELGLTRDSVEPLAKHPRWLSYALPRPTEKHGLGQTQRWFLLRLVSDREIKLYDENREGEFKAFEWRRMSRVAREAWKPRRGVYAELASEFRDYLAPGGFDRLFDGGRKAKEARRNRGPRHEWPAERDSTRSKPRRRRP